MSEYNNKGRLALWKNDKREKATHPHIKGQGEDLDGNPVWVSAWFSEDLSDEAKKHIAYALQSYNSKKPFLSVSIQPKEQRQPKDYPAKQQSVPEAAFDDIPFADPYKTNWRSV